MIRYAGSSHPEWGYLAPQPSFLRTARLMMVAAAIGATASGVVVFALVDRPAAETSVAARTLVRPEPTPTADVDAPVSAENLAQPPRLTAKGNASAPSEGTQQRLRGISTLAEAPTAAATPSAPGRELQPAPPAASSGLTTEAASTQPTQKKVAKKRRSPSIYAWRGDRQDGGGREALSLRNLFNWAPESEFSANEGYRGYPRDGRWGSYYRSD